MEQFVCLSHAGGLYFCDVICAQRYLVKARVNVPVTLLHIYWVCQYKLFLISEGWEGFTDPSKPSLQYHWSDNQ